ncbi:hypothetical protein [Mycobacterium parmense]|nr:hypothetical protein [Mycobacterium parmense]MCV7349660.1 hypothetical protein [Mycobacterium parmense]
MTSFAPHTDAVKFFVDCMPLSGILAEDVVLYGSLGNGLITGRVVETARAFWRPQTAPQPLTRLRDNPLRAVPTRLITRGSGGGGGGELPIVNDLSWLISARFWLFESEGR